ncbi:MAG: glutaredoxin family protein [candidate division WOR-3 bacterium]|nr:glutaredoxin family protein [candidate division WOR-3 bacterium]MCX7757016.1 glutaredoxin family protein [candidate division WOR-3 bacterium]MDW7987320.1 glutaredoxin family protein [candidate division WOR-3 bacterium]
MQFVHVSGINKGKILLYALSTCGWCKKTKAFLSNYNIAYSYIDVDLLDSTDREKIIGEIRKCNPQVSFPTIVINDEICIVGYDEEKLRTALKL